MPVIPNGKVCSLTYQLILDCGVVGLPEGQDFKENCNPKLFYLFIYLLLLFFMQDRNSTLA